MPDPPDLRDLVGEEAAAAELERLRRVHELLLAAGPPPELSPMIKDAPRVRGRAFDTPRFSWFGSRRFGAAAALAAGIAAAGFGIGFLAGHVSSGGFKAKGAVVMQGTGAAPDARATIEVGARDANGNVPMLVRVTGLPKLEGRAYYELYLTKHRHAIVTCGTFNASVDRPTTLRLTIPYTLARYDGWVVTRETPKTQHPGPVVLTTFV